MEAVCVAARAIAVSVVSAGIVCFTCRVIDLWASGHVACGACARVPRTRR